MSRHAGQASSKQAIPQQPTVADPGVTAPVQLPVPLTLLSTDVFTGGEKELDAPVDAAARFLREAGLQELLPAQGPAPHLAPAPEDSTTAPKRSRLSSAAVSFDDLEDTCSPEKPKAKQPRHKRYSAKDKKLLEDMNGVKDDTLGQLMSSMGDSDMAVANKLCEAKKELVESLNAGNLAVAREHNKGLVEAARNDDIRKLAHDLVADAALNGEKLKFADAYITAKSML